MANTFKNNVVIVGNLLDADLRMEEKESKVTGEPYKVIIGDYTLDTGDQRVNLRSFTREKFNSGKANGTYTIMEQWIKDFENKLENYKGTSYRVDTSISFNPFKNQQGEIITATQIQSNFLTTRNVGSPRAEFTEDVFLTSEPIEEIRDDEPTGRYILNANIFDYQETCYPARFIIENEDAYNYFISLDASKENPVLIEVWGKVINNSISTKVETESAFGETRIETRETSRRENIITGAALDEKELTEELMDKIKKGRAAYETRIAELEAEDNRPNGLDSGSKSESKTKDKKPGGKKSFDF